MIKLTEAEEKVMKAIWDSGEEPTRAHVEKILIEDYNTNWNATTISTYVLKLTNKHYIQSDKRGGRSRYKVLITEDEYVKERLRWLFQYIYKNDMMRLSNDIKDLKQEG